MFAYYLHDFDPFIFHLWGNFGPRWYGMAYVLAFACGFWLLRVLAQRGYTQLRAEQVGDFITWAALFGVMLRRPARLCPVLSSRKCCAIRSLWRASGKAECRATAECSG